MIFITKQDKLEKKVEWEVQVDDEGDLVLSANGIRTLYIDSCNGHVCRCVIPNESAKQLKNLGLKLDFKSYYRMKDNG